MREGKEIGALWKPGRGGIGVLQDERGFDTPGFVVESHSVRWMWKCRALEVPDGPSGAGYARRSGLVACRGHASRFEYRAETS